MLIEVATEEAANNIWQDAAEGIKDDDYCQWSHDEESPSSGRDANILAFIRVLEYLEDASKEISSLYLSPFIKNVPEV